MKDRLYEFDNLKGILIFLTVFAHLLLSFQYLDYDNSKLVLFIYSFHMPLFMIISGYFSKNVKIDSLIKYVYIFVLLNISFIIYDYFVFGTFNVLEIKYSSWYILLLLMYRFLFSFKNICKVFSNKIFIIIVFILSLLIGLFNFNITVLRFFEFFFFFVIGYNFNFIKIKSSNFVSYFLLLFSLIVLLLIVLLLPIDLYFLMGSSFDNINLIFVRFIIYILDVLLYLSLINLLPKKRIVLLTSFGYNSLYIYVCHRILSLMITDFIITNYYFIVLCYLITIILCILFSLKFIEILFNKIIDIRTIYIAFLVLFIMFISTNNKELSIKDQNKINDLVSIGFIGDLILLEDQVKNSLVDNSYNFDYMFDYTKKYFNNTDFVFGVLEGPVDELNEYSYGNFDDDKEIRLNYPVEFINSIKKAGINLVTVSNNHLLDREYASMIKTIDNLDKNSLDYVGSYKNKGHNKIINIRGLKVGLLAYTYGINYHNNDDYPDITSYLIDPYSNDFDKVKKSIEDDFKRLKQEDVDLIIVFPHYGTQFSDKVDIYQETWNRIFIDNGADIVFGDHSHVIQPIKYYKDAVVINSPGNYVNSFIGYDSDISMYVEVYVDKKEKKVVTSSIVPLIAVKNNNGVYYPISLFDLNNDSVLKKEYDKRLNVAKDKIENVIFNGVNIDYKEKYYYMSNNQLKYQNSYNLVLNDEDRKSLMYRKISDNEKICFIGDSITEGTKNGFHPWYETFYDFFKEKEFVNISKGGYTSKDILTNFSDEIVSANCDLYVINIGTNDIRYDMLNENDYINNIKKIYDTIGNKEVILLSPWRTCRNDYNIQSNVIKKRSLYDKYDKQLLSFSNKYDNVYYLEVNSYIREVLDYNKEDYYILDGVHPNDGEGIKLYSFATMREKSKQR